MNLLPCLLLHLAWVFRFVVVEVSSLNVFLGLEIEENFVGYKFYSFILGGNVDRIASLR